MSNPYQVVGSPSYSAPLVNLFNQQKQQQGQQSGQTGQPQANGQQSLAQKLMALLQGQQGSMAPGTYEPNGPTNVAPQTGQLPTVNANGLY